MSYAFLAAVLRFNIFYNKSVFYLPAILLFIYANFIPTVSLTALSLYCSVYIISSASA